LDDGEKVSDCIEELRKMRWINYKKKGKAISLNHHYNKPPL